MGRLRAVWYALRDTYRMARLTWEEGNEIADLAKWMNSHTNTLGDHHGSPLTPQKKGPEMSQPTNYHPDYEDEHGFVPDELYVEEERGDFRIGQSYKDSPAKTVRCAKCRQDRFIVGRDHYFTAIKCTGCGWEICIHDG